MPTLIHNAGRRRTRRSNASAPRTLVGKQDPMHTEREARLVKLRAQIARGDYHVDPHAVADAILRRVRAPETAEPRPDQNECSYPTSPPSTSAKTKPGGPSMTRPIQLSPVFAAASSASLRAVGGIQAHSS